MPGNMRRGRTPNSRRASLLAEKNAPFVSAVAAEHAEHSVEQGNLQADLEDIRFNVYSLLNDRAEGCSSAAAVLVAVKASLGWLMLQGQWSAATSIARQVDAVLNDPVAGHA